jgi:hypothetical protein
VAYNPPPLPESPPDRPPPDDPPEPKPPRLSSPLSESLGVVGVSEPLRRRVAVLRQGRRTREAQGKRHDDAIHESLLFRLIYS